MDWTTSSETYEPQLIDQLEKCAYTMGFFLGDGYLHSYRVKKGERFYPLQCVRFGKPDKDVIERVQQQLDGVFGKKYAVLDRTLKSGTPFFMLHAYRRDIFDFFAVNSEMKAKIPEPYFSASNDAKKELIAGLMDSDGYVSQRDFETYQRWSVGFANTKREIVSGLASLMASLGVKIGKIGEYQKAEYALVYRIAPNIRSFIEAGCYFRSQRKAAKLESCLGYMRGSETMHAAPSS